MNITKKLFRLKLYFFLYWNLIFDRSKEEEYSFIYEYEEDLDDNEKDVSSR